MANFSIFFPLGQKNLFGSGRKVPGSKTGLPLSYWGSKVSSGWVGSGPISRIKGKISTVSGQFFDAQVTSTTSGSGNISAKNPNFSMFFPSDLGQKIPASKAAWPLIYYGSKLFSGKVRARISRHN